VDPGLKTDTSSLSGFTLILRLGCLVYPLCPYISCQGSNESVVFIGCGLLYLQYSPSQSKIWAVESEKGYHVWWPFTLTFCFACAFLLVAPFIPNKYGKGSLLTRSIPYYVFPTVGCGVLAAGFIYWFGFAKIWPKIGFTLEVERTVDELGVETIKYKVALAFTVSVGPGG